MSYTRRKEFFMHLRHDYCLILGHTIPTPTMNALVADCEALGFNCIAKRTGDSNPADNDWQLLVGLNDEHKILKEAEKNMVMCKKEYHNPQKREKAN